MNANDSDTVFGDAGISRNDAVPFQEYIPIDPIYQELKEVKCGDCYIFSYQKFKKLPDRPESKMDAERLEYVFSQLNFDVHEFEDCSKSETIAILKEVSKKDHSQKKYFICCFLTHGGLGTLSMNDGYINTSDIFSHFTRSSCPTLSGKPKIFIIQACRGSKCETEVSINCTDYFPIESNQDYLDFLIVNSSYYDTRSFKALDEEHGSFFIDELCRSLEQFADKLGLLQILTIVNYRISYLFLSKSNEEEKNNKKQVPCFVSRLRSHIKFNKAIAPFVSFGTHYFDKRRREFSLGFESTENPSSDIKKYQLKNLKKIMFLSIANIMNINQHAASAADILWNFFAERKYSREAQEMQSKKLKKSEIMKFLNQNLNSSEIDCLLCFFVGYSRNGRLLDVDGRKMSKEDIIKTCESLTGKPKIFIYLLCELHYKAIESADGGTNCLSLRKNCIPFHADILEICIAVKEWNQAVGAMRTFCHILDKEFLDNSQEDFVNLLTKINHELVEKHEFFKPESKTSDICNNNAFTITSTLTKSLVLP